MKAVREQPLPDFVGIGFEGANLVGVGFVADFGLASLYVSDAVVKAQCLLLFGELDYTGCGTRSVFVSRCYVKCMCMAKRPLLN